MGKFDSKSFNERNFKYSVENPRVPNLKTNEMKKSKVLKGSEDIRNTLGSSESSAYARIAMKGLLDGDAVNYDGQTDITSTSTKTFERGVIVVGRAKAWTEKDFASDLTGQDFMENVADQVAEYKDGLDQDTILSILKGIFAMGTDAKNIEFVEKHTTEITTNMTSTTLNSATNKACGKNKGKVRMVFMDSDVATNLENLNVVEHLKYTDKDGMTREIDLATWNGRLVIIDDMPILNGYDAATSTTPNAIQVGTGEGKVALADVKASAFYPAGVKADDYVIAATKYVTYALGEGAIDYEDLKVSHPYSMSRDEKTNGGEETLYMRQRKVFAPFGISYEKVSQASLSPTNAELENGSNWAIVHSGEANAQDRTYINHKSIAIVRIISRG